MVLEESKITEADSNPQLRFTAEEKKEIVELGAEQTFCQKTKRILQNITVEPIIFCYVLSKATFSLTAHNLTLEKACRVNLKFGDEICDAISANNASAYNITDAITLHTAVATMHGYKSVIQNVLPSLLLMFLGSWSDRHYRRKPCIVLPLFGDIFSCIGVILCTYFFYQLPMEFNVLVEAIPSALTGGFFCMSVGIFSYISEISTMETRTLRIGAAYMLHNFSLSIGIALSGILYPVMGFYGVFGLSLFLYTISVIYGLVRVKEVSTSNNNMQNGEVEKQQKEKKNFIVDFFDLKHILETCQVVFKEGKRNRRKRLCLIMILVMLIIGPMYGEMNIMYLFVRYKFGPDQMDYSLYFTFHSVITRLGILIALILFTKLLKLDDAMLGVISGSSKIISSLLYAFAPIPAVFYLGAVVEMWNGTSFIAMRSILSKLVPPEELGKIYSLFAVFEALMPLVFVPMYGFVYQVTINILPGSFLLLGSLLTTPSIFIFLWLYKEHKNDAKEEAKEKELTENLVREKQLQELQL